MKNYYELVEKCKSWQRYATNMKAKVSTVRMVSLCLIFLIGRHL